MSLYRVAKARHSLWIDACAIAGLLLIEYGLYLTFGWGPSLMFSGVLFLLAAWALV